MNEEKNNQTEEKKEGLSGEITNDYIGYLNIYNKDKEKPITIGKGLRIMTPYFIGLALTWILIVVIWYLIGLPLGPGVYPTL